MNTKAFLDVFYSSNQLTLLNHLILNSDKEFYEAKLIKLTKLSAGSVNKILNSLIDSGILIKRQMGPLKVLSINTDNIYVREYKAFLNVTVLQPIIEELKQYSDKIVLFGSFSKGTNIEGSDIDLYITSYDEDKIRSIVENYSETEKVLGLKIQAVIDNPLQTTEDKTFLMQVAMGKILWEREGIEDED